MVRNIFIALIVLLFFTACSKKEEDNAQVAEYPIDNYYGRIFCPRCKKELNRDIFKDKSYLVVCPKCKARAPHVAFCKDMKKDKK